MSTKVDRAVHGPSWTEVILGAFLSLLLGVVIGAALLILRPVEVVRELPKEPDRNIVYHIEGSRDTAKARQAPAKRNAFMNGQSVSLTEEEINSLIAPTPAPGAGKGKAPEKGKDGKDAKEGGASSGQFALGAPNVRIREGVMQVALPVTINLIDHKVIAQARGGFVKEGDIFVFEPTEMYLGSCPVQRLPILSGLVRDRLKAAQAMPDEVKAAWQKLGSVSVDGNTLKLTMR